jgi:hypothetical protein
MGIYKQYKTDSNVEQEGIVLEVGVNSKGEMATMRIARAGGANVAFAKLVEQRLKPHKRAIQTETLDKKVADAIMRDVYASTVVLGWEHMEDENDQPLEYSKENVLKVLTDLPDLWADVQATSMKGALYREEVREADRGN